jgi:hypothetical protein
MAAKRRHFTRLAFVILVILLLPVTIWAVMTQKIELRKYAATPIPSPTLIHTPSPSPTSTPIPATGKEIPIEFGIKFDGVSGPEAEGAAIEIQFIVQNGATVHLSMPLIVTYTANGIYTATGLLTNPFPVDTKFRVSVKGERNRPVIFCKQTGQTTPCGSTEYMTVPIKYKFDFTGIPLPASTNIDQLKILLSKPNSSLTKEDKIAGDLNFDGVINGFDLLLARKTLYTP